MKLNYFKELHPTKEGNRLWRYRLTTMIALKLHGGAATHPDCQMFVKGQLMAEIANGHLYMYPPYAWNGCSPKKYIGWPPLGKWIGTPDFDWNLRASCGHDVLFQFSALLQFSMAEINYCFFKWMEEDKAPSLMRDIYHGAVNKWGGKYWAKEDTSLGVKYV
jgi:hypothetical protein